MKSIINTLNLTKCSVGNRDVFRKLIDEYDLISPTEILKAVQDTNISLVSNDYYKLVDQIKETLIEINVSLFPATIQSMNKAIHADNYLISGEIIEHEIGFTNIQVPTILVPKVMELNTLWRNLSFMNSCPGATGKPNNSIKLAELTA